MLNLNTNRTEIAITKDGEDYIRIIPRLKDGNQLELVFTFLCQDFIIRDYTIEKQEDFRIQTVHHDRRLTAGQITYHGKNESGLPVVHQKKKEVVEGEKRYETITQNILNLDFSHFICPLPVCRITINKPSGIAYKLKSKHLEFEEMLKGEYNSLDIFVSPLDYDANKQMSLWPHVMQQAVLSGIDAAIVGSARSFQHIYSKMMGSEISSVLASKGGALKNACLVTGKAYHIDKQVAPEIYNASVYEEENVLEFFDTRDFLQSIAVNVCANEKDSSQKLIYRLDLLHQLRGGLLDRDEWNYWRAFFEEGMERFFPTNTFPPIPEGYYDKHMSSIELVEDENAKLHMAMMLENDEVPDYVLASRYYKEFAEKGNDAACFRLARLMVEGLAYEIEWSIEQAVDYLVKAAESGLLEAGLSLLALYRDGVYDRGVIRYRDWAKYHSLLLSLYHEGYLPVMMELYHCVHLGIYGFPKSESTANVVLEKIEGKEIDLRQLVKQSELCVFQEQFDVHEKRDIAMKMQHDFACRRFLIEQCSELVIGIGKYPW